jgi:hypothetical protein
VSDVDGPANGGEYRPQSVQLELTQTRPGSGSWDEGDFEQKNIIIRLEKDE